MSLDFESTGLDPSTDRITEVGAILYSTSLDQALETAGFLVNPEMPIPAEVTKLTGINNAMVKKFGLESKHALQKLLAMIESADALVGQNILRFDMLFLNAWAAREKEKVPGRLVIDTRTDLPGVESKHLNYMAADAGFLNPFPHRAVADCMTVLRLVAMHNIDDVVALAKEPTIVLLSQASIDERHLCKARKYQWNPDFKVWWKALKQSQVSKEQNEAPFGTRISDIPVERLWHSR